MNRAAGFTLLELLVALVVLGLVLVGAVQGVRFGIAGWEGQSRQINATAEIDGVDRVLRDLFQGISVSGAVNFDGRPDSVTFVGSLPRAVPAQLRQAEMSLLVTTDHRLVLRWRPHRHAVELFVPRIQEIELAQHVVGIEFAYWPQSARTGSGWQANLSGGVPRLIRVHIYGERGDNRHWPDMIAVPVVTPG